MAVFIGSLISGTFTKISMLKKGDSFIKVGKNQPLIYDSRIKLYTMNGDFKGYGYRFFKRGNMDELFMTKKDIQVDRL